MDRTAFEAELQRDGYQVVVNTMQPGAINPEHAARLRCAPAGGRRRDDDRRRRSAQHLQRRRDVQHDARLPPLRTGRPGRRHLCRRPPQAQLNRGNAQCQSQAAPCRNRRRRRKHFWDGTQAGELRLQRCDECSHTYFPPRPFCPKCASRKVSVFEGLRPRDPRQLRDPSPQGARLRAALRDRRGEARRRAAHDDQHRRMRADARGIAARHAARGGVREAERRHHAALLPSGERLNRCHTTQSPSSAPRRPRNSASSPTCRRSSCTPMRR